MPQWPGDFVPGSDAYRMLLQTLLQALLAVVNDFLKTLDLELGIQQGLNDLFCSACV